MTEAVKQRILPGISTLMEGNQLDAVETIRRKLADGVYEKDVAADVQALINHIRSLRVSLTEVNEQLEVVNANLGTALQQSQAIVSHIVTNEAFQHAWGNIIEFPTHLLT